MEGAFQNLMDSEGIVKNEPATWVKTDGSSVHGRLVLTARRLIFFNNDSGNVLLDKSSGLKAQSTVEIDLDTINTLSHETHLVDTNILCVKYMQYEEARFTVLSYQDWEDAIHEQQKTPHID
jgi:hypothetical protein